MSSIGGYFGLELQKGNEYHKNAIRLNTGRNALELILKVKKYKKIYIPYYTCDVILEPFSKLKIDYEFYSIDEKLEPLFNYDIIKRNEGFLYNNYFGLKDGFISKLSKKCKNLIIDNSQAFYSKPILKVDTFYSARKFFGLPDGAYLFMEGAKTIGLKDDESLSRVSHLLKRIEYGAEAGYQDFITIDNSLKGQPIKKMSKLTEALLGNIDYENVKIRRLENFKYLDDNLLICNNLKLTLNPVSVPMVYPFLINDSGLKQKLIKNKIFVATYWPNVLEWASEDSYEQMLVTGMLPLPVDQRYDTSDMKKIIDFILK